MISSRNNKFNFKNLGTINGDNIVSITSCHYFSVQDPNYKRFEFEIYLNTGQILKFEHRIHSDIFDKFIQQYKLMCNHFIKGKFNERYEY